MSEILQIRNLSKRFGSVITANDLSLDVVRGSALGIVGPNGAGKSTLLSLITASLPSDGGTVVFEGQDMTKASAAARTRAGMARTFQIPKPFAGMTVFENVQVAAVFGGGKSRSDAYDSAMQALESTELMHRADQRAGSLPLLDRKRLELSRALATDPKLLLLDEIAGGLTDRELPPLIELIKGLRERGITIIWIEHIVHALIQVVDELMCLAFGRVLARGLPHEVMKNREVIDIYLGAADSPEAEA